MRIQSTLLMLMIAIPSASAGMCKYVDKSGHTTYSNVAVKGAKKDKCFDPLPPATPTSRAQHATQSSENFPSVNGETQKKRDDKRRNILAEELATEEKLLEEARKNLAEGETTRLGGERNYQKYLDRVQALKDTVSQHEKNVTALREELSGVK